MSTVLGYESNGLGFGFKQTKSQWIKDSFTSNSGKWQRSADCDSLAAISDGMMQIQAVTTDIVSSTWYHTICDSKNFIMQTDCMGSDGVVPQMHVRRESSASLLVPYFYNNTGTGKLTFTGAGITANPTETDIPNYSTATTYRMVTKAYNNRAMVELFDTDGNFICDNVLSDADINNLTGTENGYGSTTGICLYDNHAYLPINTFINIACIGDSITFAGGLGQETNDGYVQQLKELYKNTNKAFLNFGVNNDQTTHILARIGDINSHVVGGAVNIAIIMAGINDIGAARSNADILTNLESIATQLKQGLYDEVWVMEVLPVNNAVYSGLNVGTIKPLNALIANSSVFDKVIDTYDLLADPNDNNNYNSSLYFDNVHPTKAGYVLIKNALKAEINKFYTAWIPSNITSLGLWFDSSTLSDGNISSYIDKGISDRDLSQGTEANQPNYDDDWLKFNGSTDVMSSSAQDELLASQELPDAQGCDTGKGFTCTGLTYDSEDDVFWCGNFGHNIEGSAADKYGSLVKLSKDGTTKLDEIDLTSFAYSDGIQGVAYDSSDDTLWYCAYSDWRVCHVTKDGVDQTSDDFYFPRANGIVYDSRDDTLWVCDTLTNLSHRNKNGTVIQNYTIINAADQMYLNEATNELFITKGNNDVPGEIYVYDLDDIASGYKRIITLPDADAIEGIYMEGDVTYILNDGYYHVTTSGKNQLLKFNTRDISRNYITISKVLKIPSALWGGSKCIMTFSDPLDSAGVGWYQSSGVTNELKIFINSDTGTTEQHEFAFTIDLTQENIITTQINGHDKTLSVYVNGSQVGTTQSISNLDEYLNFNQGLYLGESPEDGTVRYSNCWLKDIVMDYSLDNRAKIEQYLSYKHNISLD